MVPSKSSIESKDREWPNRASHKNEVSAMPCPHGTTGANLSGGVAETSFLCDVSGMALLSHFPADGLCRMH